MKFLFFCFAYTKTNFSYAKSLLLIAASGSFHFLIAQSSLPLTDLSFFESPGPSWKLVSDVRAGLFEKNVLTTSPGAGILANIPDSKNPGKDLISNLQHGDMDMELDYMMAPGSNSGIYMQGRYEIQLLDSWGVINPRAADNAGIYERWNDDKPEGQKGFEGHAPRQNAGRAPGLWQHMKISFQAPRFAAGKKIENARILRIELNGVSIHENVELSGPTRGALGNDEVALGPLRFQGDHGPVAFRNIKITTYDKPRPELLNLKYSVYKGRYDAEPVFKNLPPEAEGSSVILSSNVSTIPNEFLIRYTGTIKVKEPGEYNFNLNTAGGMGSLKIKDEILIPIGQGRGQRRGKTGKITLPAGEYPFELLYSKFLDFAKPSLGLAVAGPGIREYVISDANVASGDPVDPILIHAPVNTIVRSFVDIDTIRVTHAVNVGSVQQVHYTYDMDKGMIVQLWRGDFLDATPMWHSRGDGSSRPLGMIQRFGKPLLSIEMLASPDAAWSADTTGSGYRAKGYVLDGNDIPTFRYLIYNTMVNDLTRVLANNEGIRREISLETPVANLYVRLGEANNIETISDGLYLLNDKSYYLRIDDAGNAKPVIRDADGHKEIVIPIRNKIIYSILF
ncbi:MAG: family 16 glycoside hydrolase [Ginsengibacter sp.]